MDKPEKLFACSLIARNRQTEQAGIAIGGGIALDNDGAQEMAMGMCRQHYPLADGWTEHEVALYEFPFEIVARVFWTNMGEPDGAA